MITSFSREVRAGHAYDAGCSEVGIAFEDAPVDAKLAEGTQNLCDVTGFFGVFEAEFVVTDDGMKLIDFNPRFFGQLGST